MKLKLISVLSIIILLSSNVALAYNPYGEVYTYEVYYNGKLLSGTEVAKPNLKIGEPFSVAVEITIYQKCEVSVMLSEPGKNDFVILKGPTTKMGTYTGDVMENNSTKIYEWTLAPTDEWKGGTMPVNFVYQFNELWTGDIIVNSGFTIAVPYISTEYYEGDSTPPTTTTSDSPTSTENPNSTPAFTLLTAALALTLAVRSKIK